MFATDPTIGGACTQACRLLKPNVCELFLMLNKGATFREVEEKLGSSPSTISRWKRRYLQNGLSGLAAFHPRRAPYKLSPELRTRVLEQTRQSPPDGSNHWSLRKLAAIMKVNKNLVAKIWKEANLKPHSMQGFMASHDPQLEEKAAAIIGLYLNPPQNAAVFYVDGKSPIPGLDRPLPLSLDGSAGHGLEYYRHGTLSLYAALNPQPGEVIAQAGTRKTIGDPIVFLERVVGAQQAEGEIHVILKNLYAHTTDLVEGFLDRHPNVQLHLTPTYSSWLNQVESLFRKLQRDAIDGSVFNSVSDLTGKLLRYIRVHRRTASFFQ